MLYHIEKMPSFTVAGYGQSMKTNQAFDIVPGLWEAAGKDGRIDKLSPILGGADCRPSGILGLVIGGQREDMEYFIGATISADVKDGHLPEGMREMDIPSATWVIIQADGDLPQAVQGIYQPFYSEWLPNSDYQLEDLPVIECYLPDKRQEVWFAINGEGLLG